MVFGGLGKLLHPCCCVLWCYIADTVRYTCTENYVKLYPNKQDNTMLFKILCCAFTVMIYLIPSKLLVMAGDWANAGEMFAGL